MSRRHAAEKREILPDAKYGDKVLTKFMNNLMLDGKKSIAEGIVYGALERVQARLKREPIQCFHEALENVKPTLEVRSRRVGGASATRTPWKSAWRLSFRMPSTTVAPLSRSGKTPIKWPTRTKRSAIIAGKGSSWHATMR
jgi:hypothetical protein